MRLPKDILELIHEYVLSPKIKRKMFLAGICHSGATIDVYSRRCFFPKVIERICFITQTQCVLHYGYAIQCIPKQITPKTMALMRSICDEIHYLFSRGHTFNRYSGALTFYLMRCARYDKFIMPARMQSCNILLVVPKRFWLNFRESN